MQIELRTLADSYLYNSLNLERNVLTSGNRLKAVESRRFYVVEHQKDVL